MRKVVGIRFKKAGKIYYFSPEDLDLSVDCGVIVETARGMEYGKVVIGPREVEEDVVIQPLKPVLRKATEKDERQIEKNRAREKEAFQICLDKIAKHGLEMKLINVDYTFDMSKVIFFFTAEGRIDFRELVKDLAAVFRTRIELRQVGVRDEAKVINSIGCCGRPLCCATFLGDFEPVSIRMAKEQNLSLNPTKISGICGRLMCCLNYEQSTYEDIRKRIPKVGSIVKTEGGTGVVVSNNIIKESVKVKLRCKKTEEEVLEDYKIENIELVEGSYEDSVEDSDIKLEVTSEEDRKLMKDLMKDI